ncbi:hypothetical protein UMZ34_06520 [Halopseudomonas pachastrellae]|nr:hypothetical protein UMZ34_06520 [Halopseudomonas pachastrellae]
MKLLLNQDDPGRMARMLRYYEYVGRARVEEIGRFNDTIAQVQQASAAAAAQQAQLQEQREGLASRAEALRVEQRRRTQYWPRCRASNARKANNYAAAKRSVRNSTGLSSVLKRQW